MGKKRDGMSLKFAARQSGGQRAYFALLLSMEFAMTFWVRDGVFCFWRAFSFGVRFAFCVPCFFFCLFAFFAVFGPLYTFSLSLVIWCLLRSRYHLHHVFQRHMHGLLGLQKHGVLVGFGLCTGLISYGYVLLSGIRLFGSC
ncbi:hypothetical protein V8F06_012524 [Rhypophila decipiens]